MNTHTKIELAAGLVILVLLAFIAISYHKSAVAEARAEGQQQVHQQENQRIESAIAAAEQRWQSDRKALLEIVQAAKSQSPAQVVQTLPRVIELPQPVFMQPATQGTTSGTAAAPTAQPGDLVVPAVSSPALLSDLAAGKVCKGDLALCATTRDGYKQERDNYKADAKNWENTAKGGSVGKRIMKGLGCAGLTGASAGLGGWFKGWTGAAVGGAIGSGTCAIIW